MNPANSLSSQIAQRFLLSGTNDPTVTPTEGVKGSIYIRYAPNGGAIGMYQKNDNGITTNWGQVADSSNLNISGFNLGTGTGVFDSVSQPTPLTWAMNFRTLVPGSNVTFDTSVPGEIKIDAATGAGSTGSNVGVGFGIYRNNTGSVLNFKTITGAGIITISNAPTTDEVQISAPATSISNGVAGGEDLVTGSFPSFTVKQIVAGANISLTANANGVTVAATGLLKLDGTNAMGADLDAGNFKVKNVASPTIGTDAANKTYVDTAVSGGAFLRLDGTNTMAADLDAGNFKVKNVAAPTIGTDAVNKTYADTNYANTQLSNLGTTAVNADINPSTDLTRNLGNNTNAYNDIQVFRHVSRDNSISGSITGDLTNGSRVVTNVVLGGFNPDYLNTTNTMQIINANLPASTYALGYNSTTNTLYLNNAATATLAGQTLTVTGDPLSGIYQTKENTAGNFQIQPNIYTSAAVNANGVFVIRGQNSDATTGTGTAGTLNLIGGSVLNPSAASTITGGATNIVSGSTYNNASSGSITIRTNSNFLDTNSVATGALNMRSGDQTSTTATGGSGVVNLRSGDIAASSGASGTVTVRTGNHTNASSTITTGNLSVNSGTNAGSGATGTATIGSGANTGSGNTGQATFQSGQVVTGTSGLCFIRSGYNTGTSGTSGGITAQSGDLTGVNPGTTGTANYQSGRITNASGTGSSGQANFLSGNHSGVSGFTGAVYLFSGNATNAAGSVTTGQVSVSSGTISGTGASGAVVILSGAISNGGNANTTGVVSMRSGNTTGTGGTGNVSVASGQITGSGVAASGSVSIYTGNAPQSSGVVTIYTGTVTNAVASSANVEIFSGDSLGAGGNSGNIRIYTPTPSGGGTKGVIDFVNTRLTSLAAPVNALDATTKLYVDDKAKIISKTTQANQTTNISLSTTSDCYVEIDGTGGPLTVTMPTSPANGTTFMFFDKGGTIGGLNNISFAPAGGDQFASSFAGSLLSGTQTWSALFGTAILYNTVQMVYISGRWYCK